MYRVYARYITKLDRVKISQVNLKLSIIYYSKI